MALSNHERVGKGLDALKRGLGPYVLREMKRRYGADQLEDILKRQMHHDQLLRMKEQGGGDAAFVEVADTNLLLKLMRLYYNEAFFEKLGHNARNYVHEVTGIRNSWAHEDYFSLEDAARHLDTIQRLLKAVGAAEEAAEVGDHYRAVQHQQFGSEQRRDDRYGVVRLLGSGGMAEVYLARDKELDRDVALKYLRSQYAADPDFVRRFEREARSAASLSHPNIVPVYDRGQTQDGTYYIVMEYVPGDTLKDYIRRNGWLPAKTAAEVAAQIAGALDAAHRRGVIHRDVKPQNVLITETGGVKVTDFGIARAASDSTITRTGQVLGSEHYLSPEQALGEPAGPQSDLYSLGIVLYEMLTGELPYTADTPVGVIMQHINGHFRPPREINPEIPEGINALTVKLLSKRPEERHQSAAELLDDLEKITDGKDPATAVTEPLHDRNREETERARPMLTEIVVSPDPGGRFQTIGQALREVRPDGRIRVRPGVYRESLVIDKPVEVIGEKESGRKVVIESAEGPCLSISADKGTLRGMVLRRLEDTEEREAEYGTAVAISAGQVALEDCDITSAAGCCIEVHGSEADPAIRSCKIHGGKQDGVLVYNDGEGLVEDCDIFANAGAGVAINTDATPTIRNCKIYDGQISGVYVCDEGKGLVEDCDIFGNGTVDLDLDGGGNLSDGITIATKGSPVIRRCRVHELKGAGVWVFGDGAGTVEDCDLFENGTGGVVIEGSNPVIRRCKVHDGNQAGVDVSKKGTGLMEDCDIFGNAAPGVVIEKGANPTIRSCEIHDGKQDGVWVTDGGRGLFEDCDIFGNAYSGVAIDEGANPIIRSCKVHDGERGGVLIDDAGGLVEDCDIFSNRISGVLIAADANPTIRSCKIYNNGWKPLSRVAWGSLLGFGVFVYNNGEGLVEDCDIFGNVRAGVVIRKEGNPIIQSCEIHDQRLGVLVHGNSTASFVGCDILDNTNEGIHVHSGSDLYLDRCTITGSGDEAVRVSGESTVVTHENCNLEGNARGPWRIEDGAKVHEA